VHLELGDLVNPVHGDSASLLDDERMISILEPE
jgi:hypothetical protein